MEPREFVALVDEAHRVLSSLAAVDANDVPASLAADAVPALHHVATLADNAVALMARRVEISGSGPRPATDPRPPGSPG